MYLWSLWHLGGACAWAGAGGCAAISAILFYSMVPSLLHHFDSNLLPIYLLSLFLLFSFPSILFNPSFLLLYYD